MSSKCVPAKHISLGGEKNLVICVPFLSRATLTVADKCQNQRRVLETKSIHKTLQFVSFTSCSAKCSIELGTILNMI